MVNEIFKNFLKNLENFYIPGKATTGLNLTIFYLVAIVIIYLIIFRIKNNYYIVTILFGLNIISAKLSFKFFTSNFIIITNDYTIPIICIIVPIFIYILYLISQIIGIRSIFFIKTLLIVSLILPMCCVFIWIYSSKKNIPYTTILNFYDIVRIERYLPHDVLYIYAKEFCINNNLNLTEDEIKFVVRETEVYEYTIQELEEFDKEKIKAKLKKSKIIDKNNNNHSVLSIALGFGSFSLVIAISILIANLFS